MHEVRVSPDNRSQAVLGSRNPSLELVTLFEDGAVLRTMLRPSKAVWRVMAPGMRAHPADLHEIEAVDGELLAVVRRHEERVDDREREAGVRPVAMDSMRAHLAVRLRSSELLNARFPAQFAISGAVAVAAGLFTAAVLMAFSMMKLAPRAFPLTIAVWTGLGTAIVVLPVFRVTLLWVAPYIVRLRPGPSPRLASELMAEAGEVPRRPLPDESEW